MENFVENINEIISNFYKSSGIGVVFFDTELNIRSYTPLKNFINDYISLGMSKLTSFLTEEFSSLETKKNTFYTFFLESNLICNIVFLTYNNSYAGAFVTQPVLVNKLNSYELDTVLDNFGIPKENRRTVKNLLLSSPIVSYDKIMPLGNVLNSLVYTSFSHEKLHQVIKSVSDGKITLEYKAIKSVNATEDKEREAILRHSTYSNYIAIKEKIQNGDTKAMRSFLNEINAGSVPMNQLHSTNYIRSLKNSFIKICTMCCYAAIEADAPFYKTMDIADDMIREIETVENISDIYEMMKNALLSFTRTVAVNRKTISCSKPVRLIIDYIESHYAEKISLNKLANLTNLSETYISNILKKETGFSLCENVNKVRVEQSKNLLLNTTLSIQEVALRVGFNYQNHFALIFKKYTGLAPTEFRKPTGFKSVSHEYGDEISVKVFQEIRDKLSVVNRLFDVVRIVDPVKYKFCVLPHGESKIFEGTCYDFWEKNRTCENCISTMAYINNETCVKIEQKKDVLYLVMATPVVYEKKIHVIELLKNITRDVQLDFNCEHISFLPCVNKEGSLHIDQATGLYNRQYIDANLSSCFRRNKHEKKPFSIILSSVYVNDAKNNQISNNMYDELLAKYAQIIMDSLEKGQNWAGRYAGNVFLVVLNDADNNYAKKIAEEIDNKFKDSLATSDQQNGLTISLKYSVKTNIDDIQDAESLIKLAGLGLY